MPDYKWPPMDRRRVMGKPVVRVDAPVKAAGRARYSQDVKRPGMLYGVLLTCPHAHAKVTSVDTGEAERMPGVKGIQVISGPGTEIQWAGTEIAIVAAETEEQARDAARKIQVGYDVFHDHFVREDDLRRAEAAKRAKAAGEVVTGDPGAGFKEAEVVSEGEYGVPVVTHSCFETHGQVIAWDGKHVEYFPSTQGVTTVVSDLAKGLGVPAGTVHSHMDHIGGGFGSKFAPDRWGVECAKLSKKVDGNPVKMHLDRRADLTIAGCRPSYFGKIRLGAKKDGTILVWESKTWGTSGIGGGSLNAGLLPYVFTKVPNRRINHSSIPVNAGGSRPWRAPNHPQVSYLTCSAMEDLAAKLKMDPLELFKKNAQYTRRAQTYIYQLDKAAELAGWSKNWHPRGDSGRGHLKRGLGVAVGTWGGMGHRAQCRTTIHPDGSVLLEIGSQDLGTGTRTIILQTAAETLGLKIKDIRLNIGDNRYPFASASGGSTTVGGTSAATRKSTVNALQKLFEAVAPSLGAPAGELEAVKGKIQVKGNPSKSLSWKAACAKLGVLPIQEMGANNPRSPGGLIDSGVGGAQIADVTVDTETGIVKINQLSIVQDCGFIINPRTAESQCFGAATMAICTALMEERVMDQITGRFLNANLEFYKLAGIKDVGQIVVHLDIRKENDSRGVIGLGEPPVIPGAAAIGNAVANAIGVRVPVLPLTPNRVLGALEGRRA